MAQYDFLLDKANVRSCRNHFWRQVLPYSCFRFVVSSATEFSESGRWVMWLKMNIVEIIHHALFSVVTMSATFPWSRPLMITKGMTRWQTPGQASNSYRSPATQAACPPLAMTSVPLKKVTLSSPLTSLPTTAFMKRWQARQMWLAVQRHM